MGYLTAGFALLVAAAGWYYMFYSQAAQRLAAIEDPVLNHRRVRMRKLCGLAMTLLAVCFSLLIWTIEPKTSPISAILLLSAVFVLLAVVIYLALLDVRLTRQLHEKRKHS
jgi:hypothetical protein